MQSKKTSCVEIVGILAILIAVDFLAPLAQAQTNAQERTANLRAQLLDVQARQAELQIRQQQLDEELKPEKIEHSLAGVGSVHPEELREARRRQLEIERRGVQSQPDTLAASPVRLETAIAAADAENYWQSARPGPNVLTRTDNVPPGKRS